MVEVFWTDQDPNITLYCGDNRIIMPELEAESIDSIVTDPPYELGFMGKGWDRSGIAYDVSLWSECLRVLKPGGHLLAFGGSRTYHRLAYAIEDAGFEIRDQIQWLYGSGFPKSLDVSKAIDAAAGAEREVVGEKIRGDVQAAKLNGVTMAAAEANRNNNAIFGYGVERLTIPTTDAAKQWNGWGTALKPAHEPIVLARKPLIGTVAENVLQHGTGGLNIDGCRIEGASGNGHWTHKREIGDGNIFGGGGRQEQDFGNNNPSGGRWPANVIHDGSDEVLAGFPETAVGALSGSQNDTRTDGKRNGWGLGGWDGLTVYKANSGSAARFFYIPKADKADRGEGLDHLPLRSAGDVTDRKDGSDGLNSPRAGAGRTNGSRNNHPTVKPTDLMRYLCRLVTPPKGLVLDPFAGSGSTGKAARAEGFRFIGIEINEEYCKLAAARCEIQQRSLFGE